MTELLILKSTDAGKGDAFPGWLSAPVRDRLRTSSGILMWGEMSDASHAAVALVRMDWDSSHFDSLIGEIIIEVRGKKSAKIVSHILPEVIEWACLDRWQHISVHVDSGNAMLAEAVGRSGFWVADTKLAYRRHPEAENSRPRLLFAPRAMVAGDIEQVRKIISQADFPSRFSRDHFFDRCRVTEMHLSWLESILSRPESEQIACVAECRGNVMAFAVAESVFRADGGQGWAGYSRALAAAERSACGAALSAVGEMTATALHRGSDIECVVSEKNPAAIRGLKYLGYQLFERKFVFHRHLGSDSASSRLGASAGPS